MSEQLEPLVVSANLSWFTRREEVFCYHDLVGYILRMSPDIREVLRWFATPHTTAEANDEFGRMLPEEMLQEILATFRQHRCLVEPGKEELPDLPQLVPVKAKWRVAYTGEDGQVLLVLSRTAGETPRFRQLDPLESAVWKLIDGQRTTAAIAAAAARDLEREEEGVLADIRKALASWTHHSAQVVKLHEVPLSFYKGRMHALPPYLTSTMPFEPLQEAPSPCAELPPGPAGRAPAVVDLRGYHVRDIVDPALQFDEVETTLNHLFRHPHRALHGRTYPGQMAHVLIERGLFPAGASQVVEVGGGTGSFARGFLEALAGEHPGHLAGLRYTVVELSPALAASQRTQLAPFAGLAEVREGDAESLDLPACSVDLLIANEMIGDLRNALVTQEDLQRDRGGLPPRESSGEALETIRRYGIPVEDAPPRFHLNLGAIRLLEHVASVLRPGGCAVLTEFGEEYGYPKESEHLDHAEFSIHFGQLLQVARRLKLSPRFEFLMDFLDMDRSLQTLATTRPHLRNLQALFARHGRQMLKLAYTREDLLALADGALDLERVEALHFDRIEDRICGLVPHHFKILICSKERAS